MSHKYSWRDNNMELAIETQKELLNLALEIAIQSDTLSTKLNHEIQEKRPLLESKYKELRTLADSLRDERDTARTIILRPNQELNDNNSSTNDAIKMQTSTERRFEEYAQPNDSLYLRCEL